MIATTLRRSRKRSSKETDDAAWMIYGAVKKVRHFMKIRRALGDREECGVDRQPRIGQHVQLHQQVG